MAKGSMKDIESSVSDAIDNDGTNTPDTVMDHDDQRGDGTFGTTATPSQGSAGLQTSMIRGLLDHFANGRATPDDLETIQSMITRGQNGTTGRGAPMQNTDSRYMDEDGSSGRGDGRIPDYKD